MYQSSDMAPIPPRDQRHLCLCYQVVGYTEEIDLAERMRMVYTGNDGIGDEIRLDVAGLPTAEEMVEDGLSAYWLGSERVIPDKGDLSDYWVEISSSKDFLRGAPSYTYIRDPVRRLCHMLISYNISGRGQAPKKKVVAAGALEAVEDAHVVDEGAQANPAPVDVKSLRGLVKRSMTDQGRVSTWMISYMMQLMEASGQTYQAFDGTFLGSSPIVFERHTRHRTSKSSTFAAPQQPDL
ncbi:hypothetical protein Tco_1549181 [Tanacetum coccineum]